MRIVVNKWIQEIINWTFLERSSQMTKLDVSCIIPKENNGPPCGSCQEPWQFCEDNSKGKLVMEVLSSCMVLWVTRLFLNILQSTRRGARCVYTPIGGYLHWESWKVGRLCVPTWWCPGTLIAAHALVS
jgi:hypothetical protein